MPYVPPHLDAKPHSSIDVGPCTLGGTFKHQTQESRMQDHSPLKLYIRVLHAEGLLAEDFGGTSDPYVIVKCGAVEILTKCVSNCLNPKWYEQLCIGILPNHIEEGHSVEFEVHDKDRGRRDELLGSAYVNLDNVPCAKPAEFTLNLDTQGTLEVQLWTAGPGAVSGRQCVEEEHAHAPEHDHDGEEATHHGHHETHAEIAVHEPSEKKVNLHDVLPDGSLIHLASGQTGQNLRMLEEDFSIDALGDRHYNATFEIYHEGDGFLLRNYGDEELWLAIDEGEVVCEEEDWATIFYVHGHFAEEDTVGFSSECGSWLAVNEDGTVYAKENEDNIVHDDVAFTVHHADE